MSTGIALLISAMEIQEENQKLTPLLRNPTTSPKRAQPADMVSQSDSSHHHHHQATPNKTQAVDAVAKNNAVSSPREGIRSVAAKITSQPLPCSDPDVWGVLTAISDNARKRVQGMNMLLSADSHTIGRVVDDARYQIESSAVSQRHCQITRRRVSAEDVQHPSGLYECILKDSSTNGTFVNWEKFKRNSSKSEVKLNHGDIISFVAPPHHEQAFVFVFREVERSSPLTDGNVLKRKAEDFSPENKRLKGIGVGAPVSLDDFRRLQRSNRELRKQLEEKVLHIDASQKENRALIERHQSEMKDLKESISRPYLDRLEESKQVLESKSRELEQIIKVSAEQKQALENLSERLAASLQSCTEANDIVKSQKASILELMVQLDEERDQRRAEREKAAVDLKSAVQKVQFEAQEELKRLLDAGSKRERELQEVINKLQESEKESSSLLDSLRFKLEDVRQKLVLSDNKVRQTEALLFEEQQISASRKKKAEELELEIRRTNKALESEKAAREEAWAKVSALELEINAAMSDLDFERQRLKGARERIMLRETQLRAFYSTTEEIKGLFTKQQEQLKAMQRTLKDEDEYQTTSLDLDRDLNQTTRDNRDTEAGVMANHRSCIFGENQGHAATSPQRLTRDKVSTSSDEASVTEKHDCEIQSHADDPCTQEAEFPNDDCMVKVGFGSDIECGMGTSLEKEGGGGTEQVPETQSPGFEGDQNIDLNKSSVNTLAGETCQLEDEDMNMQETGQIQMQCEETEKILEDTQPGTIQTADLLASEVAGSWACSTAPSVHEKDFSQNRDNDENNDSGHNALEVHDSSTAPVPESQYGPASSTVPVAASSKRFAVHVKSHGDIETLSKMIGILAPDLKEQFRPEGSLPRADKSPSWSCSDTEDSTSSNSEDGSAIDGKSTSFCSETQADDDKADIDCQAGEAKEKGSPMEEDKEDDGDGDSPNDDNDDTQAV